MNELAVDVLDYMFVEWLVRRSLYSRFAKNLVLACPKTKKPRSIIRNVVPLKVFVFGLV